MNNKIEIAKTIFIIALTALITYYFGNQWIQNRLIRERNTTIMQVQNEIHRVVRQRGSIDINLYEVNGEGEIQIVDNIILIESNGK